MSGKICFLFGDDGETPDIFVRGLCSEWRDATILAIDYDFVHRDKIGDMPIKMPMDLIPHDLPDRIFRDYYAWQTQVPAMQLDSGKTIYDAARVPGFAGGMEGWIVRVGNVMHVRMRFVATILTVMERLQPREVCMLGYARVQPWAPALLQQILAERFPDVSIVAPTEAVTTDHRTALWSSAQRAIEIERTERQTQLSSALRARWAASLDFDEDIMLHVSDLEQTLNFFDSRQGLSVLNRIAKLELSLSKASRKLLKSREKSWGLKSGVIGLRERLARRQSKLVVAREELLASRQKSENLKSKFVRSREQLVGRQKTLEAKNEELSAVHRRSEVQEAQFSKSSPIWNSIPMRGLGRSMPLPIKKFLLGWLSKLGN